MADKDLTCALARDFSLHEHLQGFVFVHLYRLVRDELLCKRIALINFTFINTWCTLYM